MLVVEQKRKPDVMCACCKNSDHVLDKCPESYMMCHPDGRKCLDQFKRKDKAAHKCSGQQDNQVIKFELGYMMDAMREDGEWEWAQVVEDLGDCVVLKFEKDKNYVSCETVSKSSKYIAPLLTFTKLWLYNGLEIINPKTEHRVTLIDGDGKYYYAMDSHPTYGSTTGKFHLCYADGSCKWSAGIKADCMFTSPKDLKPGMIFSLKTTGHWNSPTCTAMIVRVDCNVTIMRWIKNYDDLGHDFSTKWNTFQIPNTVVRRKVTRQSRCCWEREYENIHRNSNIISRLYLVGGVCAIPRQQLDKLDVSKFEPNGDFDDEEFGPVVQKLEETKECSIM